MLVLVECVLNQAVVPLIKTLALVLHLSWPIKLDKSKNNKFTV